MTHPVHLEVQPIRDRLAAFQRADICWLDRDGKATGGGVPGVLLSRRDRPP